MPEKALQPVKNDYEGLNAQLLDELPKLYSLSLQLLQDCIAAFVQAQREYVSQQSLQLSDTLDVSRRRGDWDVLLTSNTYVSEKKGLLCTTFATFIMWIFP